MKPLIGEFTSFYKFIEERKAKEVELKTFCSSFWAVGLSYIVIFSFECSGIIYFLGVSFY